MEQQFQEFSKENILGQFTDQEILEYKEAFAFFDKNGDSYISASELEKAMQATGANPTKAEIDDMINTMDLDGNSKIDFEEFLVYMARYKKHPNDNEQLLEAFAIFDKDSSGKISARELQEIMANLGETLTDEEVEEMLREADTDNSGDIDYREYVKVLTKKLAVD